VVKQVYAYIRDHDGRFLLQNDRGRYNLPGGKPEHFDADEIETLRRECLEESQVAIERPVYLGYVRVDEGSAPYAQLRYLAEVGELRPIAEDPATGKTYGREFVDLDDVTDRLQWGDHGVGQVETIRTMV
jgi:8-oxo-dGTP pyrophosphatase MutT (NUDIX family)